jgi:hypothetical protein
MLLPPVRFFSADQWAIKKTGLKKPVSQKLYPSLAIRLSYCVNKTRDFPPHPREWFGFI